MKEQLKDLLRESGSPTEGRNRLREFLQARILASLQVALDVAPFLEDAREIELVTRENVLALL